MKKLTAPALAVVFLAAASGASAQPPQKSCADAIPPDCKTVKYLGEDKGCACFACNPDTKQRKVVCTKSEDDKQKLMKLRAAPPTPEAPPKGAAK